MSRIIDAVQGLLIADSLGVPHEFKAAHEIPPVVLIDMVMPPEYRKTYPHIDYGTWSDDGSQMLCLLESLMSQGGRLDALDFGRQLVRWHDAAWHQAGGVVYDVGGHTRMALELVRQGKPVPITERGQGNGSLMRALPAAFIPALWRHSPVQAIEVAVAQSSVTHPHPVPVVCCAVYVQLAMLLLEEPVLEIDATMQKSLALVGQHPALADPVMQDALRVIRRFGEREMPTGSGYVVDSLWSAIWSLKQGRNYVSAVRAAVSLGQDTDTTAAIAGGLAAIIHGLDSDATRWREALHAPPESQALLQRLIAMHQ